MGGCIDVWKDAIMALFGKGKSGRDNTAMPGSLQFYEDARIAYDGKMRDKTANDDRLARMGTIIETMDREVIAWQEHQNVNAFDSSLLKIAYLLMQGEPVPTQWKPTSFDLYYLLAGLYQQWSGKDYSTSFDGSRGNIGYLFTGAVESDEWLQQFVDMFQQLSRYHHVRDGGSLSLNTALRQLCEQQGLLSGADRTDAADGRVAHVGHDDGATVRSTNDRIADADAESTVRLDGKPAAVNPRRQRRRVATTGRTVLNDASAVNQSDRFVSTGSDGAGPRHVETSQDMQAVTERWSATQLEWQTTMRQMQSGARELVRSMRDFQERYVADETITHARQLIETYIMLDSQYTYQSDMIKRRRSGNAVAALDEDHLKAVKTLQVVRDAVERQLNMYGVTVVRSKPGTPFDPELHKIDSAVGDGRVGSFDPDTAIVASSMAPGFHSDQFAQLDRKEIVVLAGQR